MSNPWVGSTRASSNSGAARLRASSTARQRVTIDLITARSSGSGLCPTTIRCDKGVPKNQQEMFSHPVGRQKKKVPAEPAPVEHALCFLLLIVERTRCAELAAWNGSSRASRQRRHADGGPIALQQHRNHGSFRFLDESQSAFRVQ